MTFQTARLANNAETARIVLHFLNLSVYEIKNTFLCDNTSFSQTVHTKLTYNKLISLDTHTHTHQKTPKWFTNNEVEDLKIYGV